MEMLPFIWNKGIGVRRFLVSVIVGQRGWKFVKELVANFP